MLDRGPQPVGGASDERTVECAGDLQPDCSSSAEAFSFGAQLLHGRVFAGDDDLARAVVVGGPDADDSAAEVLDRLVLESEDGGHRAGMEAGCFGHREAPFANEANRVGGAERLDRSERSELADGMPDDDVRLDPARTERSEDRE